MTFTAFPEFDPALQTAELWIDEVAATLGPDRRRAWRAIGRVLRDVRDRLPPAAAHDLGAQLPLLVRGCYYEDYRPGPAANRAPARLGALSDTAAAEAVLVALGAHLGESGLAPLRPALPPALLPVWRAAVDAAKDRQAHP
jgi:uncharacterized protein (DUF2267 family)